MSVELPDVGSSLSERSLTRTPRKNKKNIRALLRWIFFAALASGLILALVFLGFGFLLKPRLDTIYPPLGEPGQMLEIRGDNFGSERGESRIEIDGVAPTASSYQSWSATSISVRLPASVDSGLVRVVTRRGSSNPKLFMNKERLPLLAEGQGAGRSGPYLESLSVESGGIGSLLVLTGLDFGASRGDSSVQFCWTAEGDSVVQGGQAAPTTVSPSETDLAYELWSDKEIRLRVPDGAVSGAVTVLGPRGLSNGIFFQLGGMPGVKRYFDRRSYAVALSINVNKIRASKPNELYFWAPKPLGFASQRCSMLAVEPAPLIPDYKGLRLFRFKDIDSGSNVAVRQSFLVQTYAVETELRPESLAVEPRDPPALMAQYSSPDALVPSGSAEIAALARKIVKGERNPWRAARLIWDWLTQNLAWTARHEHAKVLDALKDGSADSYSYALIASALLRAAGIPSLPVAGYLVDPMRRAARHYWVELYLYGFGWLPLDPILGSGATPGNVEIAWNDRQRYFGGLDNRHIAFARGLTQLAALFPEGKRVSKDRRWSFQSFYEESVGGIEAYSSFWGDMEVTGVY